MANNIEFSDTETCSTICESVLDGTMKKVTYHPSDEDDFWIFLHNNKKSVIDALENHLKNAQSLKFYFCTHLIVKKYTITPTGTEVKYEDLYRRTGCKSLLQSDNIDGTIEQCYNDLIKKVTDYHEHGSGWLIHKIVNLELYYATYKPFAGKSYIPTPIELKSKQRYLINIKNNDNMCFKWCILAALYPCKNPNRCKKYDKYKDILDFTNLKFPLSVKKVHLFEKMNNIGVNVIGYDSPNEKSKKELYPLYISKERDSPTHVNLLYITQNNKGHYILIKSLNALLKGYKKRSKHFCIYCFHGFSRKQLLEDHINFCKHYGAQKTVLPLVNKNLLFFKDYSSIKRVPFVIYADFESILLPVDTCQQKQNISSTTVKQVHIPCGYCIIVVGPNNVLYNPKIYRGKDCISHFFKTLFAWEKKIINKYKTPVKIRMTVDAEIKFKQSKVCYMCHKPFNNCFNPPVRDHCHLQGTYLGPCHNSCNINCKLKRFIPVIFHNLKSYDSHLLLKYMKSTYRKVSVIPSTKEKYISFSVGHLRFLDSYQFLPASLDTLISNLVKSDKTKFKAVFKFFDNKNIDLLLRKGIFPYSYCSSFNKFNEGSLPDKSAFYNDITKEDLSDDLYAHAQKVWVNFNIKTLGEYHDLYVKCDTLSLCDVFEAFRELALNEYKLDPCHFYTTPGFAFNACLYKTNAKIELITCPSMYLFIESALRGGVCQISKRYAKANNPYTSDYNSQLPTNYLFYCDMNNLYGHALTQYLPCGDFCFLSEQEINQLNIMNIPVDSEYGYIIQCDLVYNKSLHDTHSDFPLAVERKKITKDMLSPYSLSLHKKLDTNIGNYEKLVPNLMDKYDYICHYRNLQLYIDLGMTLSKMTCVLRFIQKPWLKSFIDFNTKKRAMATTLFEKSFYKYVVNSIYGKSVQNPRKQINIQLANRASDVDNILKKPNIKYWDHINENLVLFHLNKLTVKLDKPIYVGFTVLELSKHLMYSFHYNHIKKKYGDKVSLLMMDTDSYIYNIETEDIYKDMYFDRQLYDFSNYDENHPLFSNYNKKKVGVMKDELAGDVIEEFVALKPKMYSVITNNCNIRRAKGVSKHIIQKVLNHEKYKSCLFTEQQYFNTMTYIQSKLHEIRTIDVHKKTLSPCDTKRYQIDAINSLPYGHYKNMQ